MAIIEILEVKRIESQPGELFGAAIDRPKTGETRDVFSFEVSGWVIGNSARATSVELVYEGKALRSIPIYRPRHDVEAVFSDKPEANNCGFWAEVGVVGLAPVFELLVRAVLSNDSVVPIGTIQVKHKPISSEFNSELQPITVTALGRSGTTWLLELLAHHPQIVVHQRHPYETRLAIYWMQMLKVLSEPANWFQSGRHPDFARNLWTVGHNPYNTSEVIKDSDAYVWLARDYVQRLAAFCLSSIDAFYLQLARDQKQGNPIYYAEKWSLPHFHWLFLELYPQCREIILVRDPRDLLCSIRAFNKRRASLGHGFPGEDPRWKIGDQELMLKVRNEMLNILAIHRRRAKVSWLVRYEDLVLDPETTLDSILQYLDLDGGIRQVRSQLRKASKNSEARRRHVTSPSPQESIGRWRRDLDPSLQAQCQEIYSDILDEFGYV